jgi:hypothetical protein
VAQLEQTRDVVLVSGAEQSFVVTSRMLSATIPVELPHLNVFVLSVSDVTDPKQDALARVAMLADLTTLPIGRDPGIATPGPNGIEYLSAISVNAYSTLETAIDAAVALQDRVSALVVDWESFRTQFNAPSPTPAIIILPKVDASQKTALINAYAAAKQVRYQAQLDKTAADDALARATADYSYKSSIVTGIAGIHTDATQSSSNMSAVIAQFGVLLSAGNTFYAANTGGTGAAAFLAALTLAAQQQSAMPGFATLAASVVADLASYATDRNSDVTAASIALTAAQADQITKAQALISAQAIETNALNAVLAVCPDFDKHSIPFVPDTEA